LQVLFLKKRILTLQSAIKFPNNCALQGFKNWKDPNNYVFAVFEDGMPAAKIKMALKSEGQLAA
jgi:hypothetical protein